MKNLAKITDEELIEKILQDDHDALGELYSRYYQQVFHKCLSLIKDQDEAFDLTQEALLKAFDNLASFRGDSTFSTWLYTITHRCCLQALRKKSKSAIRVDDYILDTEPDNQTESIDESIGQPKMEDIMFSLIRHLPSDEKELLIRKYYKGESIKTLQNMYHVSSSAIKMRLKRSKERLNQLFPQAMSVGLVEN